MRLVEAEQGMVAGTAEVAVEDASLLVAVGRADRGIQIENQLAGWSSRALIDTREPEAYVPLPTPPGWPQE